MPCSSLRRLLSAAVAAAALGACEGDPFSFDNGSVRVLAVLGDYSSGRYLVEYSAPPLRERRRLALNTPDTLIQPVMRDAAGTGFYALIAGGTWLARYGADWRIAAAIPLDTPWVSLPWLGLTADERYLVMAPVAGYGTVRTLDPLTLATVHTFQAPATIRTADVAAAEGQQMLFLPYDWCPRPMVRKDVVTGATVDSTDISCSYTVYGLLSHDRMYRLGLTPGGHMARLELYDQAADQVVAAVDSILILWPSTIFLDRDRRQLINVVPGGAVDAYDARSLAWRWRVSLATGTALRGITRLLLDPASGALVGTAGTCAWTPCNTTVTSIIVVDPGRHVVAVDEEMGQPVDLVR